MRLVRSSQGAASASTHLSLFFLPLLLLPTLAAPSPQDPGSDGSALPVLGIHVPPAPPGFPDFVYNHGDLPVHVEPAPQLNPTIHTAAKPPGNTYKLDPNFDINDKGVTRTYNWIVAAQPGAPDGYQRDVVAINGQTPGPLIEANEGDTIVVNVVNQLNWTITLHWHGLHQNSTPFMDGVPGITQCPIPANGGAFTYKFTLDQYGTYWYHSHSGASFTDGLQGPIVIHSVNDPLKRGVDFDEEEVIMLADWYHDQSANMAAGIMATGYQGRISDPAPQSGIMNGQGSYNCSLLPLSQSDSKTNKCTSNAPPPQFVANQGDKYRFRLINAGTQAYFLFSVDDHPLNVTEADGTPVRVAATQHRLPFHNGERYSVIIDTSDDASGSSYWIRAAMRPDCMAWVDPTLNPVVLGVLRVGQGSGSGLPTSKDWSDPIPFLVPCDDLESSVALKPIVEQDAPATSDVTIAFETYLGLMFGGGATHLRSYLNGTSFVNYPYHPILPTVAAGDPVTATNVFLATIPDSAKTADIIINNLDPTFVDHPYHIHGFDFWIIGRGVGGLTTEAAKDVKYNLTNPLIRDTFVVPAGTWAVVRVANNLPGLWVVHCHIAWHLAQGFLAAIIAKPDEIASIGYPAPVAQLCAERPSGVSVNVTEPGRRGLTGFEQSRHLWHDLPENRFARP